MLTRIFRHANKCITTKAAIGRQFNKLDVKGYVLLIFPSVTFCLGCWQVQRRKWKLNLLDMIQDRITAEPIDLPVNIDELSKQEYMRVLVRGQFIHEDEIYLSPRNLVSSPPAKHKLMSPPPHRQGMGKAGQGSGLISDSRHHGVQVITPFLLSSPSDSSDNNHKTKILVNRGWVPMKYMDPRTRLEGQVDGEIELRGLLRLSEKKPVGYRIHMEGRTVFQYRDIDAMARLAKTRNVLIDADSESTASSGPIGGQTRVRLRNTHTEYIITWWLLSALSLLLWYRHYFR